MPYGDISKTYCQISVCLFDRIFRRILWRPDLEGCVETLEFNRVPSPYSALPSIKGSSKAESGRYPAAADVVERDIDIDDSSTATSVVRSDKNLNFTYKSRTRFNYTALFRFPIILYHYSN